MTKKFYLCLNHGYKLTMLGPKIKLSILMKNLGMSKLLMRLVTSIHRLKEMRKSMIRNLKL
jgi:hypothetical protein